MQLITVPPGLEAPWHLARVTRRNTPWNRMQPNLPVNTFYDCVRTGLGVDIYHVDSGADTTHSEITGKYTNVWNYYGAVTADIDSPTTGHGTAQASELVGTTCGLARNATAFGFKIFDNSGFSSTASANAGLDAVLSHYTARAGLNRPAVALVSLAYGDSTSHASRIAALIDAGMVVVCPVHNFGTSVIDYPAAHPDVIGAGGIGFCDLPYYEGHSLTAQGWPGVGSNWGAGCVDVLAPAQRVRVAHKPSGGFTNYSGNSFACPIVTAIVACMLEGHPRFTTRAQVQAVAAKLIANATTGKLRPAFGYTLPDRIAYLNPSISFETF